MKSHFVPEPEPQEREPREQWLAGRPALVAGLWVGCQEDLDRKEFRKLPDLPMRNFLRVIFAQ